MQTFTLKECEEYVQAEGLVLNQKQILQYYMIFGGVPYYWGFLKKGYSLAQNIDRILFEAFTLFYFKFLKNPPTDEHFWSNQLNTPAVNTWMGLAFERVCMGAYCSDKKETRYIRCPDRSIRNKIHDLQVQTGTKYAIYPTMVTTCGLVRNSYADNIQSVITLGDLFV